MILLILLMLPGLVTMILYGIVAVIGEVQPYLRSLPVFTVPLPPSCDFTPNR